MNIHIISNVNIHTVLNVDIHVHYVECEYLCRVQCEHTHRVRCEHPCVKCKNQCHLSFECEHPCQIKCENQIDGVRLNLRSHNDRVRKLFWRLHVCHGKSEVLISWKKLYNEEINWLKTRIEDLTKSKKSCDSITKKCIVISKRGINKSWKVCKINSFG